MARAVQIPEVEAPPEADRLEGVPHPRVTARLFGHDAIQNALAEGLASGRMHHGWLLSGPEGVGKATLAYRFAMHALAAPGERGQPGDGLTVAPGSVAGHQVRALSHPNLLVIRRPWDHKNKRHIGVIPVDEVRRIKMFLAHASEAASNRVVIVDTADQLNINAANALLKSLEEPPPRTYFLLLTAIPGRLLATIRSRCRVVDLAPLGEADLRRAVAQALNAGDAEPPAAGDWSRLVALSDGSVRRALALWLGDGLKLDGRLMQIVGGMPSIEWQAVHGLGEELSSAAAAERFEMFFDLLLKLLARLVRAAAGLEASREDTLLAQRLIAQGRLATWAELWETVGREKSEALALNLDRKSLILQTFGRIGAAAGR